MSVAYADLHVHTTNSDGLASPTEVFARARERGVSALAVADHSGVSFDDGLVYSAAAHGVDLVWPATEVSTMYDGNKFHVLLYGPGVLSPEVREFAFRPTAIKNEIYRDVIRELRELGHDLPSEEEMLAGPKRDGVAEHLGKWMLSASLLVRWMKIADPGVPEDEAQSLVRSLYDMHAAAHSARYVDTIDSIRVARAAGALPVLAHAWWECWSGRNDAARVRGQVGLFADAGLGGLEVSSRHADALTVEEKRALAADLGLIATAGSDYHANGKTDIGQFGVSRSQLYGIVEAAEERFRCILSIEGRAYRHSHAEFAGVARCQPSGGGS
jgi:predicted metal-dependent phosphoesterase TrpH